MTSTHPREAFRPRARRLLSRLAAVLVVGSLALGGAPATAADEESDAPTPADPTVTLSVSTGSGTMIAPGGPLVSSITVQNATESELTTGTVALQVNRDPLADGEALDAWLDDGTVSGTFHTVATEPTPIIEAGAESAVTAIVDAGALGDLEPGVYPVQARLSGAATDGDDGEEMQWNVTASNVLVVADAGTPTSAVLVPITATPENGSLLTADELAELTTTGGALAGLIDAVMGTTAILAIDPSIPAAIRMLGSSAPQSAVDWLAALERLPNDVFALQFGDADATAQAHAGLPELLSTPDLTALMQASDLPPAPEPTATPSPTPAGTVETELPEGGDLTEVVGATAGMLWPRGNVSTADLATFATYLGDDVTTILPSTALAGNAAAHATVDGHDVLAVDAAASERLSAAVEQTDPTVIDRELTAAAGHLLYAQQRSATTLLALDRSETRTPAGVRAALSAFASSAASLADLRASAPASATLAPDESASRGSALNDLLSDEQRLVDFSTILDEPELLLSPTHIRVLRTIGVGLDDAEFAAGVAAQSERVQETLDAVGIQQPKPVQLFTSAAPLPVWVRNELPWNVNVSLFSTPSDVRLDIQPVTPVTAPAAGSTRVDVPIEARVASGEVDVTFWLRSPTGVPIGQATEADVTLRADWEGIGLGILGGVIALLLVLGTIRTVLHRKRAKADAAEEPTTQENDD